MQGDWALFIGDWDGAAREYGAALESSPDAEIQSAALLGLARVQLHTGETDRALRSLRTVLDTYPGSSQIPAAQFFLGRVFSQLQRHEEAAQAYGQYLQLRPGLIDRFVYEWQGDAYFAAGDYVAATEAFNLAAASAGQTMTEALQIKAAQSVALAGDYQSALALYDAVYATSSSDFIRAQANFLRAEIFLLLGRRDEAHHFLQDSVANYPVSPYSYWGLITLLDSQVPVSELDRGLVDYFAGEYSLAVSAFERYLSSAEDSHDGTAHHYMAAALREIGSYQRAVAQWQELIDTHETSDPYWPTAWEEKGFTEWAFLDNYSAGIDTFLGFVARVPDHGRAAEFLFFAGQVAERDGQLDRAAEIWRRLDVEYPTHALTFRAIFLAAIAEYRMQQYAASLEGFRRAAQRAVEPGDLAATSYWIGKSEAMLGFVDSAQATWRTTASLDPTGYYSERALDLLQSREPFTPPQAFDLVVDWEAERRAAEDWMRSVFALEDELNLTGIGPLADNPLLIRGTELWRLGEYDLARTEFENLRAAVLSSPVDNYRLANYLVDLGLYRTAIFCARQVLNLAGMGDADTLGAPAFFNHVRFGTYFKDLVLPIAQQYELHPLLVYSVMRQESLFEGFARSSAGARGLMQIIPSTGQQIQANLGWPENYSAEDLHRPYVNVRFGVDYLHDQLALMEGSRHAALAAYNAGPGNALVWKNLAGEDPDLFLEIVRFSETQRYIRGIYEVFVMYRRIYDRSP